MSLLTICQNVAREVAIAVPSTIVGNTAEEAVTLLRFAQREGRQIAEARDWSVLLREHAFTTVAGTAAYDLPTDFRRFLTGTAWDRTEQEPMRGPITGMEWQFRKSGIVTSTIQRRWRVLPVSGVAKFTIDPTPASAASLVFEYVSTSWCQSAGGTAQSAWAADTDTGRIDEDLVELGMIWRVLARLGRAYAEERAEYEIEKMRRWARDGGMAILRLDGGRRGIGERNGEFSGSVPTWGGMGGATWGNMGG